MYQTLDGSLAPPKPGTVVAQACRASIWEVGSASLAVWSCLKKTKQATKQTNKQKNQQNKINQEKNGT